MSQTTRVFRLRVARLNVPHAMRVVVRPVGSEESEVFCVSERLSYEEARRVSIALGKRLGLDGEFFFDWSDKTDGRLVPYAEFGFAFEDGAENLSLFGAALEQ